MHFRHVVQAFSERSGQVCDALMTEVGEVAYGLLRGLRVVGDDAAQAGYVQQVSEVDKAQSVVEGPTDEAGVRGAGCDKSCGRAIRYRLGQSGRGRLVVDVRIEEGVGDRFGGVVQGLHDAGQQSGRSTGAEYPRAPRC